MANIATIKADIENRCAKAVSSTCGELKDELVFLVDSEFYSQYSPVQYIRTGQLGGDAPQSKVISNLEGKVMMDGSTLRYNGISGDGVIALSAGGWHGYVKQTDGRYWESFIGYCGSNAVNLLIKNLK